MDHFENSGDDHANVIHDLTNAIASAAIHRCNAVTVVTL
jgi:hypothetical protein